MIKLALYLFVYMIPAGILGYLLLLVFPHTPAPLLVLVNLLVIVGGLLAYKRKLRNELQIDGRPADLPDWIKGKTVPVFLAIATIFSSMLVSTSNKTDLYIDNATGSDVTVKISHEGSFTIGAGKYKKLEVVKGDIEVEYNGKRKNFSMPVTGNWVLNLDKLNSYFLTTVTYSSHTDLFRNSNGNKEDESPGFAIIKDEFFNAKVDYVFDVPEKITIKKSRFSFKSKDVDKTVLYRKNEYLGEEEPYDAEADTPVKEDGDKKTLKSTEVSKPLHKTNRRDEK